MNESVYGNLDADGASSSLNLKRGGVLFVGSTTAKDFGGGSVSLQAKGPDGEWYESGDAITTAVVRALDFPVPTEVRIVLGSATGPDLDYAIVSDQSSYRD